MKNAKISSELCEIIIHTLENIFGILSFGNFFLSFKNIIRMKLEKT